MYPGVEGEPVPKRRLAHTGKSQLHFAASRPERNVILKRLFATLDEL
jgi:hypothetical protein